MMKEGTLVDATIFEAPPSTKNAEKRRDPEMRQATKGNHWHFGMKANLLVDADSGLVHSLVTTATNELDVSQSYALVYGHEREAFGDAGYTGVGKREEMKGRTMKWHMALRRGKIKAMPEGALKDLVSVEPAKAQIRACVEYPFHVVKSPFRHRKLRYKGLLRNPPQSFSLFALANPVVARNRLRPCHGSSPSRAGEMQKICRVGDRNLLQRSSFFRIASRMRWITGGGLIDQRFPRANFAAFQVQSNQMTAPADGRIRQVPTF